MPIRLTNRNLGRFTSEVQGFVQQVGVTLDQAIVSGTPVDTGRARANWFLDIGSIRARVTGTVARPDTTRAGRWRAGAGNILIHNSIDYIVYLDDGSSRQAPQGIIDPAIAQVRARFA